MTREEAIEVIRKEYACVDADCDIERNCGRCELHMPTKEPILKACEMAIQALSQEPICDHDCEHCTWTECPIEPCDDAEQIDYHDDFATALKKINDYEMTRDERAAISILNAYKVGYESGMEDLEQEPCEDAISREAVLKIIDKWYENKSDIEDLIILITYMSSVTQKSGKWINYSDEGYVEEAIEKLELMRQKVDEETYRALILAIKALEQKSKTGHWIHDETIENWRCSKCNETPKTMGYVGTADFMAEHFKFCNHCGARMVEPQESEDKE